MIINFKLIDFFDKWLIAKAVLSWFCFRVRFYIGHQVIIVSGSSHKACLSWSEHVFNVIWVVFSLTLCSFVHGFWEQRVHLTSNVIQSLIFGLKTTNRNPPRLNRKNIRPTITARQVSCFSSWEGYECTKIFTDILLRRLKGLKMYKAGVALKRLIVFFLFTTIKV